MSMFQVTEGASANFILPVAMLSSSTGEPLSGIAAGSVQAWYKREGSASVAISVIAAATEGVYQSGGWIACASVGAGNYELHIPNNAFLTGARYAIIYVGATGAVQQRYVVEIGAFTITLPTNFSSLSIDASGRTDVGYINGNVEAAVNLDYGTRTMRTGAVTTQVSVTSFIDTSLPAISLLGKVVGFVTGPNAEQVRTITGYDTVTKAVTVNTAFASAPAVGNTYVIM